MLFRSAGNYRDMISVLDMMGFTQRVVNKLWEYGPLSTPQQDAIEVESRRYVDVFLEELNGITKGYHDWRLLGSCEWGDQTAVLVRYYREDQNPLEMIDDESSFASLRALIPFDLFSTYCRSIFKTIPTSTTANSEQSRGIARGFFSNDRYGLMVMVFEKTPKDVHLVDLFDWHTQKYLSDLCVGQIALNKNISGWRGNTKVGKDGILSKEVQIVQNWMRYKYGGPVSFNRNELKGAMDSIYAMTGDPAMLDFLGRLAKEQGDETMANEYYARAHSKSFHSLETIRHSLRKAVLAKDEEQIVKELIELNNYWNVKLTSLLLQEDRNTYIKFESRWKSPSLN